MNPNPVHPDTATAALTSVAVLLTHAEMNRAAHQVAGLLADQIPHCAYLDLEHSDQGDWLTTHSLHTASGQQICLNTELSAALLDALETYACHLYVPHLSALPGLLDSPGADARLDLALTLARSPSLAQELIQHTLLELVAIPQYLC